MAHAVDKIAKISVCKNSRFKKSHCFIFSIFGRPAFAQFGIFDQTPCSAQFLRKSGKKATRVHIAKTNAGIILEKLFHRFFLMNTENLAAIKNSPKNMTVGYFIFLRLFLLFKA